MIFLAGLRGRLWWCPFGCGKSVVYTYNRGCAFTVGGKYMCIKCGKYFEAKEL